MRSNLSTGEFVTVRALFFRGRLPGAIQHTANIILIPRGLLAVADAYGVARLRDWAGDTRYMRSALE